MNGPELSTLSLQAFVAVLGVLSLLALAVQLLTTVFRAPAPTGPADPRPAEPPSDASAPVDRSATAHDPFVQAALHGAVRQVAPNAVVARVDPVEEEQPR